MILRKTTPTKRTPSTRGARGLLARSSVTTAARGRLSGRGYNGGTTRVKVLVHRDHGIRSWYILSRVFPNISMIAN